ncbi:MAG TPA: VanZ family protein [Steroidobacteraceae bacterium]|nr:VanZ family protein [Steroidobacteraceae bacterium]
MKDQIDPIADHPHLRTSPSIREWGSLLVAAALTTWVVYSPRSGQLQWVQVLHNSGHGPIFGLVAILLLIAARTHRSFRHWPLALQCVCAVVGSAGLGLAAEALQAFTHRDPSWMDALNDLVGAVTFVGAFAWFEVRYIRRERTLLIRSVLALVVVAGLVFLLLPAATAARAYWYRESSFPVLADFDQYVNEFFLSGGRSVLTQIRLAPELARHADEHALEVRFQHGAYPGIDFIEPRADWRDYETLALDIANPTDQELSFVLRVHDRHHNHRHDDRFNRILSVAPHSRAVLEVPLRDIEDGPAHRKLDLDQIAGMTLFRRRGSTADRMDVCKVWLE